MNNWVQKKGYDTCLMAPGDIMQSEGTEVYLIRFSEGKFAHYHKETTEFFHFTAGTGRVLLDGKVQKLFPGVSIVIKPFVQHSFINDSTERFLEAVMVKTNANPEDTFPV